MPRPGDTVRDVRETGDSGARQGRPLRLFRSDFLERFSRTSLATIILFWVPVSGLCIVIGPREGQFSPAQSAVAVASGAVAWTLVEYLLHRFFFHLDRWVPAARPFTFLIHGCHHADPADAGRDIMPLAGSIPIFAVILGGMLLLLGHGLALLVMGGFGFAYLSYDVLHYACHQWRPRGALAAALKRHHLIHHYVDGGRNFGVTSPLWDWLFGTLRHGRPHGP